MTKDYAEAIATMIILLIVIAIISAVSLMLHVLSGVHFWNTFFAIGGSWFAAGYLKNKFKRRNQ